MSETELLAKKRWLKQIDDQRNATATSVACSCGLDNKQTEKIYSLEKYLIIFMTFKSFKVFYFVFKMRASVVRW